MDTLMTLRTLVALIIALVAVDAAAQDQPVTFLHGWNGDTATWGDTKTLLTSEYQISSTNPAYNTDQAISQIVSGAPNLIAGPGTAVVSHSMGGLVSREFQRQIPGRIDALITVGTPHEGSGLANNLAQVPNLLADWVSELLQPVFTFFGVLPPAQSAIGQAVDYIGVGAATALQNRFGGQASVQDMKLGSSYLAGLNGDPSAVPPTMYTIYSGEDRWGHWRLLDARTTGGVESGDGAEIAETIAEVYKVAFGVFTVVELYYAYRAQAALSGCHPGVFVCPSPNPNYNPTPQDYYYYDYYLSLQQVAATTAVDLLQAIRSLHNQDREWREIILNIPTANVDVDVDCARPDSDVFTDVVVGCRSQKASGLAGDVDRRFRADVPPFPGINHLEQSEHPGVRERLREVFTSFEGIPQR